MYTNQITHKDTYRLQKDTHTIHTCIHTQTHINTNTTYTLQKTHTHTVDTHTIHTYINTY